MKPERFHEIVAELVDENPLAIRPLLTILETRFTNEVPTLAVTCASRPTLLVNLAFVSQHCQTDAHVKAVILHEFLHVLLRHTERTTPVTEQEHVATDAVINAIIHRSAGPDVSSMFSKYYAKEEGVLRLLRPPTGGEPCAPSFSSIWRALYEGHLVVDDIREIVETSQGALDRGVPWSGLGGDPSAAVCDRLLGNHGPRGAELEAASGRLSEALDDALRAMNGAGIWRSPRGRGTGTAIAPYAARAGERPIDAWRRKTAAILRKHLTPDRASLLREPRPAPALMPVLNPRDRRAFVRAMWSPFLPEAAWEMDRNLPTGSSHVYLDVSGSMWAEMAEILALLQSLRRYIRKPFRAFSDKVSVAEIRDGRLVTESTGGTSIQCVLEHIAETKPACAVIVTDGYIETVQASWLPPTRRTRIHAVVTRNGQTTLLDRAGIRTTHLEALPR